jgi:hypothetical protein
MLAARADQPAPRTQTLFMGVDLAVQRETSFYRVVDVNGSELKIKIGKKEFFVPTQRRLTGLKVDYGLKLAQTKVQLDDLQSGPAYTPANDPVRKFNAASGAAGGAAAVRDLAYGRMIAAEIGLAAAGNALAQTPENSASRGAVQAAFDSATAEYSAGAQQAVGGDEFTQSQQFDTTAYANQMALEKAAGNYDAMEVSFKVSSPVELTEPYMVILFKYQERDAKEGDVGMLIHAKQLERIGPKPKYIRVREGGLPVGFKFVDCSVHIYNHGGEVATNLSTKSVELSREEAQQYLVIEHMGAHKQGTVPAAVVPGGLSAAMRGRLTAGQLERTVYAKISKDGALLGVYLDESGNMALSDPLVADALAESFFKPALVNGKPVEGIARVRLADLAF